MINLSNFTKEERDECLPIIDILIKYANIARKEGVLVLEDFTMKQNNDFLTFATMHIVDGTDPDLVKGMLETLINAENYTGSALLERALITEGVLSVQAGEHPHLLETKLLCMLGEGHLRQRGHFPVYDPSEKNARRVEKLTKRVISPESEEFCQIILEKQDEAIRQAFMQIDIDKLSLIIKGCSKEAAEKLIKNVSPRLGETILNTIEFLTDSGILEAQREMLEIFKAGAMKV
jgi:hypothetical protein